MARTSKQTLYRQAQDVAFLWRRRAKILRSTANQCERVALDQRLDNHLETLAAAGEAGHRAVSEAGGDSRQPGHGFASAYMALTSGASAGFRGARWIEDQRDARTFVELVAAIGWMSAEDVVQQLRRWSRSGDPWLARLGIAGIATHRLCAGSALGEALRALDPALRATAANVAGKLGAFGALGALRELLSDGVAEVALQAARSAARFTDEAAVKECLVGFAEGDDARRAQQAIEALAPIVGTAGLALFRRWAVTPRTRPIAVALAEELGARDFVPSLLVWMNDGELARRAGDAFTAITGVHLAEHDFTREAPPLDPEGRSDDLAEARVGDDRDHALPFPAPLRVAGWWREHERRFDSSRRYVWGTPTDGGAAVLLRLARTAPPRCQLRAARELALLRPKTPALETHAAATWGRALPGLDAWSSVAAHDPLRPYAPSLKSG